MFENLYLTKQLYNCVKFRAESTRFIVSDPILTLIPEDYQTIGARFVYPSELSIKMLVKPWLNILCLPSLVINERMEEIISIHKTTYSYGVWSVNKRVDFVSHRYL